MGKSGCFANSSADPSAVAARIAEIMNEFGLFAHGATFDVDGFLKTSSLSPDFIWRVGDQYTTNGFELILGDGRTIPIPEQQNVAISYLKAHREELRSLANFPGVDTFNLALQYHVESRVLGLCVSPCAQLMWHALDIGLSPTFYVWFHGEQEVERRRLEDVLRRSDDSTPLRRILAGSSPDGLGSATEPASSRGDI